MSLSPESRSETAGAAIHVNHYCCTEGCVRALTFGLAEEIPMGADMAR